MWMRNVAREMNLSETAFFVRHATVGYDLRWFTPAVEVDLCGHATVASAHVLWQDGHLPAGRLRLGDFTRAAGCSQPTSSRSSGSSRISRP